MRASCSLLITREQDAPTTFNNYGSQNRRGIDNLFLTQRRREEKWAGGYLVVVKNWRKLTKLRVCPKFRGNMDMPSKRDCIQPSPQYHS